MKIKRLYAENFRNIEKIDLSFGENVQLILGENAQGKTNLLEAIFLCSSMRSFRTTKENMMIRAGQKNARVRMTFEKKGRQQEMEVVLSEGRPKQVFLDGRQIQKTREAIGLFRSVLFTPDHLLMIKGAPGERREFMDMALCAASPRYTEDLLQYNKALKNRNRLLKCEDPAMLATLPLWDETLCRYGARIAQARAEFLSRLAQKAAEEYDKISSGGEKMKLLYINQFSKEPLSDKEYYPLMMAQMEKARERDRETQTTGRGVHKDDFLVLLAGKSAKYFGSQGQIRSSVLAIKIAEAILTREQSGTQPVILLDDILSELDKSRQQYILSHTFENQCVVTACEPDKLEKYADSSIYIKGGQKDVSPSGRRIGD